MGSNERPHKITLKASLQTKLGFIFAAEVEETMNDNSLNIEHLSNSGAVFC